MTLSLEAIHQTLTDFFLNKFRTDAGSQIQFRFDKYGSAVSDSAFIDLDHPEWGYIAGKAQWTFSYLVNRIPVDDDGVNILLSQGDIDDTYYTRLLSPSIPYLPNGLDDATKQAIIQAFGNIKADALKVWNDVVAAWQINYKPSSATPENWYDTSKNEVWTSHSFQVTDTTPGPSTQLWKLKLSDVSMQQVLQLPEAVNNSSLNIPARILELQPNSREMLTQNVTARAAEPFHILAAEAQSDRLVVSPLVEHNIGIAAESVAKVGATPTESVALYDTYLQQHNTLDISKKLLVNQYLGNYAPTQPVQTSSISVSFDYCLINALRLWYKDVFINDTSWCIPTVLKGQLTTSGPAGNLPLIPIGFVAIRNLNIEGNWTAADEANASLATGFGPFQVTWDSVNKKLSYPGLQIIGWVLQKMPDLPPNNPPGSTLEVPQQVSPADGSVFNNYPRTTTLEWTSVSNAASYTVELDCYHCCEANKWCSDVGKTWIIVPNLQTTSYTFQFVGAQPGRWRVWAVDASGREGAKSPWREFRYTV